MASATSNAQASGRSAAVKSAERALAVLEHVAASGAVSFAGIVESLGLPRSSTHGLLRTLVAAGWLERQGGLFRLGLRAWEVGEQYGGHRELVDVARPVMNRIAAELGETVQLAKLDGAENIYIAISHSPHPMRLASSVGMRLPAHATGIGKALLSLLSTEEVRRRLSEVEPVRLTPYTITDRDELAATVEAARTRRYATDDEEYLLGCVCVAAPVGRDLGSSATPIALSVTVPAGRVRQPWPSAYLPSLWAAAAEIRANAGLVL